MAHNTAMTVSYPHLDVSKSQLFNSKIDVQRYAIIQYIQDNYRDVTLSTVAKRFHYSN